VTRAELEASDEATGEAAVVAARQQLVGEGTLTPELSEDPRERMRSARGGGGRPQGGRPPGGYVQRLTPR